MNCQQQSNIGDENPNNPGSMADEHDNGPALPKFDCFGSASNVGPRWTRWLKSFELFADGKGLILTDDATAKVKQRRRALLLHHAGPDVQDIFFTLAETGENTDYNAAVRALNAYFVPKVNTAYARHQFRLLTPNKGETMRQFATSLCHGIKDCGYGDESDNQIRDELLAKCTSDYIRRKLLEEGPTLTLARALEIGEQCEGIEAQMAVLATTPSGKDTGTVNRVSEAGARAKPEKGKKLSQGKTKNVKGACYRCGQTGHYGRDPECPARGKTCIKCQGKDHSASVCTTSRSQRERKRSQPKNPANVRAVEAANQEYAFTVNSRTEPTLDVTVGNQRLNMLIDSGALSNVVSVHTWEQLKQAGIKCSSRASSNKKLYAYASDEPLTVKGTFTCSVKCGQRATRADFLVVEGKGVPLLGRNTAMELGVLKIGADIAAVRDVSQKIQDQYPELFAGVGKLNTHQVALHIDKGFDPIAQPMRRIPFHLCEKVKDKIQELIEADVIEKVIGPTRWLNPDVVAPKLNGEI